MRDPAVTVVGWGARSQLGLGALQVATGARAQALEPRETRFVDAHGDPVGLALCDAIDPERVGFDRFVELGAPALREAAARSDRPPPLVLALPDADRPDQAADPRFEDALIEALGRAAEVPLDRSRSRVVRAGHAGFAEAMRVARGLASEPGGVLCGAVDSPSDGAVVRWLDERGQLLRLSGESGRVPGEAAAFLRLELATPRAGARAIVRGADVENQPADQPPGHSLGRLLRRLARTPSRKSTAWILSDVNGEPARTDAWLAAESDASELFEGTVHEDLVQHTSDVGAATGALLAVIAIEWARIGAVRAPNVLIATSADGPARGVLTLDLPTASGRFVASASGPHDQRIGSAPGALRPTPRERAHLARLARGRLEDLGSMGMLLTPGPEGLEDAPAYAQRLLCAFDALAALGFGVAGAPFEPELLEVVRRYGAELSPPDPPRRFACAFAERHLVKGKGSSSRPSRR